MCVPNPGRSLDLAEPLWTVGQQDLISGTEGVVGSKMAAITSQTVLREPGGKTSASKEPSRRFERKLYFQGNRRLDVLLLAALLVLLQATAVEAYCNNDAPYSCVLWVFCGYGNPTFAKTINSGSSCDFVHWKHQIYTSLTVHGTMVVDNAGTTYPHIQASSLYVSTTGKISAVGEGYGAQSGSGPGTSGGSGGERLQELYWPDYFYLFEFYQVTRSRRKCPKGPEPYKSKLPLLSLFLFP